MNPLSIIITILILVSQYRTYIWVFSGGTIDTLSLFILLVFSLINFYSFYKMDQIGYKKQANIDLFFGIIFIIPVGISMINYIR